MLQQDGADMLLEELRGATKKDAEKIVAHYRPAQPAMLRDRVEVLPCGPDLSQLNMFSGNPEEDSSYFRSGSESGDTFRVSFAASEEFMSLLQRVREFQQLLRLRADCKPSFFPLASSNFGRHCFAVLIRKTCATRSPNG